MDEIKLTEAKEYWFICNIAGHCLGGMKFIVNLTQASSDVSSRSTHGYLVRMTVLQLNLYQYLFTFLYSEYLLASTTDCLC